MGIVVALRRVQTEYKARVIAARDAFDADWISDGLDDPSVLGGIYIMPILRQGIATELGKVTTEDEQPKFSATLNFPHRLPTVVAEEEAYFLTPQDSLVQHAKDGQIGDSPITDIDVHASLVAETAQVDDIAPGFSLTQYELRHRKRIVDDEKWIGYETLAGIKAITDYLQQPDEPSINARDRAITAYLEKIGIWDPSEEQRKQYGAFAGEWIDSFQQFWDEQIGSLRNGYLSKGVPEVEAMIMAQENISFALGRMTGKPEEDLYDIKPEEMGREFYLALLNQPKALLQRIFYEDSAYEGIDRKKVAGEIDLYQISAARAVAEVDSRDIHRKPPPTEAAQKAHNRLLYAATETVKSWERAGHTDVSVDNDVLADVEQRIARIQDNWQKFIDVRYNFLRGSGMHHELAAFISERDTLQLASTVANEQITDINLMGYAAYLEGIRNPKEFGEKLIEVGEKDAIVGEVLQQMGENILAQIF